MTKRGKKLCSMLLAMIMVLTTIFSNATASIVNAAEKITVDAEQVQAGETIVHFKPTTFTAPNIYAYKDENTTYTNEWPGTKMTSEGDGWFSYTIEADSAYVIFNDGSSQEPGENQPGYSVSGEIWYVQGTSGKILDSKPGDATTKPPTSTPTPTAPSTATPTEKPSELIAIKEVTPGEGEIKVNEAVTLRTDVTLDSGIDYAYYKYEVKFGNEYVGDHYYSKKAEYTFKPEKEGTYTVTVYAQAHNMESTTVKTTITYNVTANPVNTDAPTPTIEATATINPTGTPVSTATTIPTSTATTVPSGTTTPVNTDAPTPTIEATATINPTGTPVSTATTIPTSTATTVPSGTTTPDETEPPISEGEKLQSVKISLSRKTPQYRGRKIKISAQTVGGSNLTYKFTIKNTVTKVEETLQTYSTKSSVTWRPGKGDIGTYRFYVYVKDNGSTAVKANTTKFKIKNKKLSIDSTSVTKKSSYYTIAANTAGGYGTIKYKYVVKNSKGKVVFRAPYSKTRIVTWKAKKGTYKIYTYVKDSKTKKTKIKKKVVIK